MKACDLDAKIRRDLRPASIDVEPYRAMDSDGQRSAAAMLDIAHTGALEHGKLVTAD